MMMTMTKDDKAAIEKAITILQGILDKSHRSDSESLLEPWASFIREPLEMPRERNLVLAVGHSRENDHGAVGYDNETYEWHYNSKLAYLIADYLPRHIKTTIINHYEGDTYTESMEWLTDAVDPLNADLVCELHFNSYNEPSVNGYEMLYWYNSKKGQKAANTLIESMRQDFPDRTCRGSKAITHGERGAGFLSGPKAPCVILEPFFGSNPQEWMLFSELEQKSLAKTLARGIAITLS